MEGSPGDVPAPAATQLDDRYEGSADASVLDASSRFLDASPRVKRDHDGEVDALCTGREVSVLRALLEPRCTIGSVRARALRAALEEDSGAPHEKLFQEAAFDSDGRVILRLVNQSKASLTLPFSGSSTLPAFTVLAEDERHTLFELASVLLDVAPSVGVDASTAGLRAHFAQITLPPGAAAVATFFPNLAVAKVLRRSPDAGTSACLNDADCTPAKLGNGRYILHVGQLLCDVEAGLPAKLVWNIP